MGVERSDRRRYPRVSVASETRGQVGAVHDVLLLDISLGGIMIEHAEVVQPGIVFDLLLTLLGRKTRLRCRVVRSTVHRSEVEPDGGRKLIFRTGLEFGDVSVETRQLIADYITATTAGNPSSAVRAPDVPGPLEHAGLELENLASQR